MQKLDNQGPVPVSARSERDILRAMERSLATAVHCRRAFERAVEVLGPAGLLVEANNQQILYRRDPDDPAWVIGSPIARWQPAMKLSLHEGRRGLEVTCDASGRVVERSASNGDPRRPHDPSQPYSLDPRRLIHGARPLSMLCRPDLDPAGHSPSEIGAWIAGLRPWEEVAARVWMPVLRPGGPEAAVANAGIGIRASAWSGTFGAREASWVVADGVRGDRIALGSDRNEVFARWRDRAKRLPDGDSLPAVAFPITARPPLPDVLLGLGFSDAVMLYGEAAETGWTFVRRDAMGGFVAVGSAIVPSVSAALDRVMDRLEEIRRAESEAIFPGFGSDREYPWRYATFIALNDEQTALGPLRGGMLASQVEPTTVLPVHACWEVHRLRRLLRA